MQGEIIFKSLEDFPKVERKEMSYIEPTNRSLIKFEVERQKNESESRTKVRENTSKSILSKAQSSYEINAFIKKCNEDINNFQRLIEERKQKTGLLYNELISHKVVENTHKNKPYKECLFDEFFTNSDNQQADFKELNSKEGTPFDDLINRKESTTKDTIEKKTLSQIFDPFDKYLDSPNEPLIAKGNSISLKLDYELNIPSYNEEDNEFSNGSKLKNEDVNRRIDMTSKHRDVASC